MVGIGGNLVRYANGSHSVVRGGASKTLFGLFGVVIALYLANRAIPAINYLGRQALALAIINLALDLFASHIDILGHLGGLISGFLLGIIWYCAFETISS